MQNFQIDVSSHNRQLMFMGFTLNPKNREERHQDITLLRIKETITEMEGHSFAVLELANFQMQHRGHIVVDKTPGLRAGFSAPDMQLVRLGIEEQVNQWVDQVYAEHPFLSLVQRDGSMEREIPEEVQAQAYELLEQNMRPTHVHQAAKIQHDPTIMQGLDPQIRKQMEELRQNAGKLIHGQTGATVQPGQTVPHGHAAQLPPQLSQQLMQQPPIQPLHPTPAAAE